MENNEKLHNAKKNITAGSETRQAARAARLEAQKAERKPSKEKRRKPEASEEAKPLFNPFFGYKKRKFPIWQRLIALVSFCAIALVVGAMFGYGGLGHKSPWAVFEPGTWQHILDFLKTD
ncbi:DNA-directed RNA polymerase subunit beta [Sporolactobacillus laevolacticus]|uniref:DNA-directed RNA polymerase subunit beta n=1 Tax=Sporolactobacillus laevolacticus TaxID=33018 RepID=UPI0025B35BC8|nr:DNA-directed RNA polymerase subunit beta [Sporolactobacillus laevolacticus]MDN3954704.1 DNA-directed RNA polymerase subunit beta [Sporolactobacillus laevolacticus]